MADLRKEKKERTVTGGLFVIPVGKGGGAGRKSLARVKVVGWQGRYLESRKTAKRNFAMLKNKPRHKA